MATLDDVRAIALSLPEAFEKPSGHHGGAGWRTKKGQFVWERPPTGADLAKLKTLGRRWPDGDVVGLRTDGLDAKDDLLAAFTDECFTIPHFDGYPAVLLRLDATDVDLLGDLVVDAWMTRVSRRTAERWVADHDPGPAA